MRRQIAEHLKHPRTKDLERPQKTVFSAVLESDLPPKELSIERLQHEAINLIGAGLKTTRWACTVGSFHILNNPPIFCRLQEELKEAIPDITQMPGLEKLEQLPYLSACVEECKFFTMHLSLPKIVQLTMSSTSQLSASPTEHPPASHAPPTRSPSPTAPTPSPPAPSSAWTTTRFPTTKPSSQTPTASDQSAGWASHGHRMGSR